MTSDEVELVARRVASLLASGAEVAALLTAAEVAARFGVDRSWVYAHARELGVVRLGEGPRPRLRFDPAVVAQRLVPVPPTECAVPGLLPIRSARRGRLRHTLGDEERRSRR